MTARNKKKILFICCGEGILNIKGSNLRDNIFMSIKSFNFYLHKHMNKLNYRPKTVKKIYKHNQREVSRIMKLGTFQLKLLP